MTEAEWEASTDPVDMIRHCRGSVLARLWRLPTGGGLDGRKIRLLLLAWSGLVTAAATASQRVKCREFLRAAEDAIDEWTGPGQEALRDRISWLWMEVGPDPLDPTDRPFRDWYELAAAALAEGRAEDLLVAWLGRRPVGGEVAGLVRCLFGNPFRRVVISPPWLTPTVVAIARRVYESRDCSPLPILADALQDAGCDEPAVLAHCRGPGPHARGCWVVDRVLGKG